MAKISELEVRKILDQVYPEYTDDLPSDNIDMIIGHLLAGRPWAELVKHQTGGHQMDYTSLIESFISIAELVISVINVYVTIKSDPKKLEEKPDSKLITSLLDERVRSDPKLTAVIEAVLKSHK